MKKIGLILSPFLISGALVFLLELCSHRSFLGAWRFLVGTPHFFLVNLLIVALSLVPALLVKRRVFYITLISGIWLVFGITNFILQSMRTTPFEPADLSLIKTGLSIADQYLSPFMVGMIIAGLVLFVFLLGILFQKSRRYVRHIWIGLATLLATGLSLFLLILGLTRTDRIEDKFADLVESYRTYGFVYCYAVAIFDRGIDEPDTYSEEQMNSYADRAGLGEAETDPDVKPNIIFVQLESFFDPSRIKGLTYSKDPTPNFTALLDACPSGLLAVPSLGAGTVNTEFEILTGMSLAYFGPSDYPYKLLIRDKKDPDPIESAPYLLREIGYTAHAIHNNTATFYSRDLCYKYLGFDTFTSIEYMQDVTYNALGWAEDLVLTDSILASLDSSDGSDYVFAVSVNGHGGYPSKVIDPSQDVRITAGIEDPEILAAYEYYINRLSATDDFIGELTAALSERGEKTVVVFYGDHLPGGLGLSKEDLGSGTLYDTEYVVWANYELEREMPDADLSADRLSAEVLGLLGISRGSIMRLHQNAANDPLYSDMLWNFEYDLLAGEKHLTGGENRFAPTDLRFGAEEIGIDACIPEGEGVRITGVGFTEWSYLIVNGDKKHPVSAELLDDGSLLVEDYTPESGDTLAIGQYTDEDILLSASAEITLP